MRWLIGDNNFDTMAGWVEKVIGLSPDTLAHLLDTIITIVVYLLLRKLLKATILRRVTESNRRYGLSKTISYVLGLIALLVIAKIWLRADISLATYLGILSAGLAIALQDAIANLAGWLFILIRAPFRVGDRIQVGTHAGDVIDTRLFMFSMLEIGNWVDADQSTGRIIHVPNGRVFKESVTNYTQGFEYIWNEIPVTVTFESDWKKAYEILSGIADEHSEKLDERMAQQVRALAHKFQIHFKHLTPIVWTKVIDYGVTMTIRYLCDPRKRRSSEDTVWKAILEAFARENTIDFAYPTQRFYDNRQEGKPEAGGPSKDP
ncbi:mechanosensitive ion channel family protein [Myxococcota bacterium]